MGVLRSCALLFLALVVRAGRTTPLSYLNNTALEQHLAEYATRCSHMSRLVSIGQSASGKNLWALELSDKPGTPEAEPSFKYVGGVHGDEPTGRVLGLALAEWLCANHPAEPRAKRIVDSMHLWILPAMNPDGFERRTRENKYVDFLDTHKTQAVAIAAAASRALWDSWPGSPVASPRHPLQVRTGPQP